MLFGRFRLFFFKYLLSSNTFEFFSPENFMKLGVQ